MDEVIGIAVGWCAWLVVTYAIIRVDARRQAAKAALEGNEDFKDRSPATYLALSVLLGPLPLFVYFVSTRRGARGWLMGLGFVLAGMGLVGAITSAVNVITAKSVAPPAIVSTPASIPGLPENLDLNGGGVKDATFDALLPRLRELAKQTAPICSSRKDLRPLMGQPSPAKGGALDRDPRVLQVQVCCEEDSVAVCSNRLRERNDPFVSIAGVRTDRTDAETGASITVRAPSPDVPGADQIRYRLPVQGPRGVQITVDVRERN